MSKVITSKSKVFSGTVTLFDRLTLAQVELVEAALLDTPPVKDGNVRLTDIDRPRLPALLACVERWDLQNFPEALTVDTFPLTPRRQAHDLVIQIFDEIVSVYNGEQQIPNE